MTGLAYYNECDPYAADWLRNLIAAGLIMPGDVDTRSIVDVRPADVAGYERCHWFAGIGVWDYALGLAGWPAGRPVWTGSCPCQPFSSAGRRAGFDDERHLWPVWFDLIRECRPDTILGEQVEAAVRLGWLDAVFAGLEGQDYACGAVVLGAHSVGAPHIRQRLWFVADAAEPGRRNAKVARADRGRESSLQSGGQGQSGLRQPERGGAAIGLGDAERIGLRGEGRGSDAGAPGGVPHQDGQRERLRADAGPASSSGGMGDADGLGEAPERGIPGGPDADSEGGFWASPEWLPCRDGKLRPTQPSLQPLVDGAAFKLGSGSAFEGRSRVGMLRGAGNAINAETAAAFIAASLDTLSAPSGHRPGAGGETP